MDPQNIPQQSHFLDQNGWNEQMDACVINTLLEQRSKGFWNPSLEGNYHPLLMAQADVNEVAWWSKTWEDMVDRQKQYKKRYETFKRLVQDYKVMWEKGLNVVNAKPSTWERITKKNAFAAAYFHKGELEWTNLKKLFESLENPMTIGFDIVDISDTSTTTLVLIFYDPDEVVSLLLRTNKPSTCKRLFDDNYVDVPKVDGSFAPRFSLANAFPPKLLIRGGTSNCPSTESSCASSSPFKWFTFNNGNW